MIKRGFMNEKEIMDELIALLSTQYGIRANDILTDLYPLLNRVKKKQNNLTQKDCILVMYPNSIQNNPQTPLESLQTFCHTYIKDVFTTIHILPFFISTSDDGFAIADYTHVDPHFGSWKNIEDLSKNYTIMVDLVLNHVSSHHHWFLQAKKGLKYYQKYFHIFSNIPQEKSFFRPRITPLYHPFKLESQTKFVLTTFSKDQIDLNYKNPFVFISLSKILRLYLLHGVSYIRFDAIEYSIKSLTKTSQLQKKNLARLFTLISHYLNPAIKTICEVHMPHSYAIEYAQTKSSDLLYLFELPALLLHTIYTQDSTVLTNFLQKVTRNMNIATYILFTSTHDGISLHTVQPILTKNQFMQLIRTIEDKNGIISYKTKNSIQVPYEANITFLDAVSNIQSFIALKLITFVLKGIPLVYINDLFASHNWNEGVKKYHSARKINRKKYDLKQIKNELESIHSSVHIVYTKIIRALSIRKTESLFDPKVSQEVISISPQIICIKRYTQNSQIYCVTNISKQNESVCLDEYFEKGIDILHDEFISSSFHLKSYETRWIKKI